MFPSQLETNGLVYNVDEKRHHKETCVSSVEGDDRRGKKGVCWKRRSRRSRRERENEGSRHRSGVVSANYIYPFC